MNNMNNYFTEGMNNYSINNMNKYYAKEEISSLLPIKNAFKDVNDKYVKYNTDKKKMQKIIIKEYINFVSKYKDKVFDSLGVFLGNKDIEKIILFTRYNKNLDNNELIKIIKKYDGLNLVDLIIYQQSVIKGKVQVLSMKVTEEHISDDLINNFKILGINENIIEKQLDIILATINMVKAIKYNYNNASISYFDKDNKGKKAYVSKKLCVLDDGFYFISKNELTIQDFISYLDVNYPSKNKYTMEELLNQLSDYTGFIRQNNEIIDDEYAKLILDEKYKVYVSNRIDNPTSLYKGPVDVSGFIYRKVLMPKNGVLLLVKDNARVESILLKEVFKFDKNNLVSITRFKDGKELVNVLVLSQDAKGYMPYYSYTKERNEDNLLAIEYIIHFLNVAKGSVINEKNIFRSNDTFLNYEVISPTYWKYRDRDYKSENDKIDHKGIVVKREFEIEIAPFIRKIGGEASNEAKSLAKKLGVVLKDGHTIVKPHTRHYNKQK